MPDDHEPVRRIALREVAVDAGVIAVAAGVVTCDEVTTAKAGAGEREDDEQHERREQETAGHRSFQGDRAARRAPGPKSAASRRASRYTPAPAPPRPSPPAKRPAPLHRVGEHLRPGLRLEREAVGERQALRLERRAAVGEHRRLRELGDPLRPSRARARARSRRARPR